MANYTVLAEPAATKMPCQPPQRGEAVGGPVFEWLMTALGTWLLGGLYLDGWAHIHVPGLETFDGNPSPPHVWLTAFARAVGASAPPRVSEEETLRRSGPDPIYYATRLRGASHEKARRELGFRPRPLEWIEANVRGSA